MQRMTSTLAYQEMKESGVLGKRRWQVYRELFLNGPLCCRCLFETMRTAGRPMLKDTLNPRFAELERMGVIRLIGQHVCPYTGRLTDEWDVTAYTATKPYRKPKIATGAEEEREACARLVETFCDRKAGDMWLIQTLRDCATAIRNRGVLSDD